MHAHLHKNEIIGFLGGTWDPERKRLCVSRALPARQLEADGTDGSVEVELDPESLPPICEVRGRSLLYRSFPRRITPSLP